MFEVLVLVSPYDVRDRDDEELHWDLVILWYVAARRRDLKESAL